MSKKSSKTSHVLNLLTNRIGTAEQEYVQEPIQEQAVLKKQEPAQSQTDMQGEASVRGQESIQEQPVVIPQEFDQSQTDVQGEHSVHGQESIQVQPSVIPQESIQAQTDMQREDSVNEQGSIQAQSPIRSLEPNHAQSNIRQIQESVQMHQAAADEKIDSVQNEPSKTMNSSTTSDTSTSYSLPSEDPLSHLIRQELEQHFETEILPFVPEDFNQKGNTSMANFSEIENQGTLDYNTIDFFDTGEYVFVNIIEEFVKNECPSLMSKMEVCSCNKCKNDVIALALNHLPPKYVVTRKGYLLSKLLAYEKQYKADVLAAVTNACIQVKSMPHHSE
ncbi:MAG: late competence development ComFB family protein [Anaerovorax sp.]|nr:late competence development ComFB family protein [Anaerovorax sp.]